MKKASDQTAVGFFVVIGCILLALFVFFVSGAYLFRSGYSLYVTYDYVSILDKGAPIRMAGVRVGEVRNVDLQYDSVKHQTRVKIKLFIEDGVEIRDNYLFKIQGTHILSEPHIEITPVMGNSALLKDGAVIEGVQLVAIEEFIDKGQRIADNLEEMTKQAKLVFGDGEQIKSIMTNLQDVSAALKTGLNGNGENLNRAIKNLDSSSESLKSILDKVNQGQGTVGKLLFTDELYQEFRSFVSEIKTHPWRLLKKDK